MGENGVILGTMESPSEIEAALEELKTVQLGGPSRQARLIDQWAGEQCRKSTAKIMFWGAVIAVGAVALRWLPLYEEGAEIRNFWAAWHYVGRIIGDLILVASIAVLGFAGWKVLKNKLKKNDHKKDTANNSD